MRYVDSGLRQEDQTVAWWMQQNLDAGIEEFRCQAGYFSIEGMGVILPALRDCAARGATLRLVLGSNESSTLASHISYLAGALSIPQSHVSLAIVSFHGALFHPKVYHLRRLDGSQTAYVGSANLTAAGISGLNVEAGIILDTLEGDDPHQMEQISQRIENWMLADVPGVSLVQSAEDIQNLLDNGWLSLSLPKPTPTEPAGASGPQNSASKKAGLTPIFRLPRVLISERASAKVEKSPRVEGTKTSRQFSYTESSFHYPQGTHLGHILSILNYFSNGRAGTPFDDEYIRLNGDLGSGRIAGFRRQIKYKLLAATEIGLLTDVRTSDDRRGFIPTLTTLGAQLWDGVSKSIEIQDVSFSSETEEELSTKLPNSAGYYNNLIKNISKNDEKFYRIYSETMTNFPAAFQMNSLIHSFNSKQIQKNAIYDKFFTFQTS